MLFAKHTDFLQDCRSKIETGGSEAIRAPFYLSEQKGAQRV